MPRLSLAEDKKQPPEHQNIHQGAAQTGASFC